MQLKALCLTHSPGHEGRRRHFVCARSSHENRGYSSLQIEFNTRPPQPQWVSCRLLDDFRLPRAIPAASPQSLHAETLFARAAVGTDPVVRKVFKRCIRLNPVFRISDCGIIDITTYVADILFHLWLLRKFFSDHPPVGFAHLSHLKIILI